MTNDSSTGDDLVQRARELRELVRAEAEAAEALGHYTPAVHEAFRDAGFYALCTPRRYGGHEVDLSTFTRVLVEVGRADPGTAWCLSLGQGHALTVGAHWPEQAQAEVFTNPAGYFRASHGLNPSGTAKRVEGGWLVNARSRYQSGSAYASHVIVTVSIVDDDAAASAPPGFPPAGPPPPGFPPAGGPPPMFPRMLHVLVPAGQFRIADDWGGDATLGMRASGSNSVVVEDAVVPEYYGTEQLLDPEATSVGAKLYGNPLYLGAGRMSFFQLELIVSVLGAARAAIDEYDAQARTRNAPMSAGGGPRSQSAFYQRDLAAANIKIDAAEAITLRVTEEYTRRSADAMNGIAPFTMADDSRLGCLLMEAGEIACTVVDLLFRSSGTSSAMRGQRMQRFLRDVWMYRTHQAAQIDATLQRYGAMLLGVNEVMFPGPRPEQAR